MFLALENAAKLSIWTVPVLLLVSLDYLRLRRGWRRGVAYGLGLGCVVSLYLLAIDFRGGLGFDPGFAWGKWVSGVLLVGFTEEVVFRGYLLQKLAERLSFGRANLLTSVLFCLVHVPRWIRDGRSVGLGLAAAALFLVAFALLLGWVLRRSGSLWACILAHSIVNFTSFALGGGEPTG